jgi:hypothetical protein
MSDIPIILRLVLLKYFLAVWEVTNITIQKALNEIMII